MFKEIKNAGVFQFKTRIPIRITDHNYGDHVANNVFVEFLHEGRVRFLASLGYAEKNLEGVALTVSELHVKYARQAFYPDSLDLEIAVSNIRGTRFDLDYRGFSESGELLIIAKTEMAAVDYGTGKPVRLPEAFKSRFA
ncbi:MAG TPA: thioesterase [Opitutae bacterium]|nr:thioesterase [Myxococcales bacterium]HCR31214.1 thioesterase [Opitutae bacterium]